MKNQDIVYKICKEHCPARTEQLEIIGLQAGISGGSVGRYLRWLAEENKIEGERKKGDATKTWTLCKQSPFAFNARQTFTEDDFVPEKPLTIETIQADRKRLDEEIDENMRKYNSLYDDGRY